MIKSILCYLLTLNVLILSPKFKFVDDHLVTLRVPSVNDVYNIDLKSINSTGGATCLVAKAALEEAHLWHKRLAHLNYKTINKLVQGDLVKGLPSRKYRNDQTCLACKKGK